MDVHARRELRSVFRFLSPTEVTSGGISRQPWQRGFEPPRRDLEVQPTRFFRDQGFSKHDSFQPSTLIMRFSPTTTKQAKKPRTSRVFLDQPEPEQGGDIPEPLAKVAERRTPVHAILVGVNVPLHFLGIN